MFKTLLERVNLFSRTSVKISFDNLLINHFSIAIELSDLFSDMHCASRSLCRPLAVPHRHSYSGTTMTSVGMQGEGSFAFFRTALDARSHPRKMRACCLRNGNSRFVSHLDFRASETIPHPYPVLVRVPSRACPIPHPSTLRSFCFLRADRCSSGDLLGEISPATDKTW